MAQPSPNTSSQDPAPRDKASLAANAVTETREVRRRGSWQYLFFIKRRPRLFGMPRHWEPPDLAPDAGRTAYYRQLSDEGFISPLYLQERNFQASVALQSDLNELDEHLLPDFMRKNQEARHFQNLYYLYQWVFIVGALMTTVIAAGGVLIYDSNVEMPLPGIKWLTFPPPFTAALSGLVTTISILNASQKPQEQWFKARTQAETLRSLYFQFLGHQGTFAVKDNVERIRTLDRRVLDVLTDTPEVRDN